MPIPIPQSLNPYPQTLPLSPYAAFLAIERAVARLGSRISRRPCHCPVRCKPGTTGPEQLSTPKWYPVCHGFTDHSH